MRIKADGEVVMSWLTFMQLTPDAIMKMCKNGSRYRAKFVELHPQGKGFKSYRSIKSGKRIKAIPVR